MKNRLFAIGDVHGCFDPLMELVESKLQLKKSDHLVLLGDYIDRGMQSREVIDYIMEFKNQGFDVVTLRGNHEQMLVDALDDTENLPLWIYNGGRKTLKSFDVELLQDLAPTYQIFFRNLPYFHAFGNYLFVHAGFDDAASDPFQDKYKLVWESQNHYEHPELAGKTIVHGHRPHPLEQLKKMKLEKQQVINLDTGCVYPEYLGYGRLTAIELHSRELFSV
ncbi:MAG TPA: metallophosphoesterase family protein [Sunxiuqinia sp.]|nr:metallophosphoesterase family protein [Sunxiuqinia sp.]